MRIALCCLLLVLPACERDNPSVSAQPPPDSGRQPPPEARSATHERFVDITAAAGIDFVHDAGVTGKYYFPELEGSGAAWIDYDGDDDLDAYLVQGGRIPGEATGELLPNRMYRNNGDHTFSDVTDATRTADTGYGMGVYAADYDNDGDTDIYVTNLGPNVLLRNEGDGTFSHVSRQAGVDDPGFSLAAAFLDFDRDGWLDLYVANYVEWSPQRESTCYGINNVRDYCMPLSYPSARDTLYRNRGDGTFEDVSSASGIAAVARNGMGVACGDFNNDGWEDVYVGNDAQANLLWINNGDGTFTDRALMAGCALDENGKPEASMGIAVEDLDHDGDFDVLSVHVRGESHTFYRNDGGSFEDVTSRLNLADWNVPDTGFGVGFLDFDNDGRLDLFVADGAVNARAEPYRPDRPYAERNRLVRQLENGKFADITDSAGVALQSVEMSRGAAFGDYDGDGRVDILISNNRGPAQLLRNSDTSTSRWIRILAMGTQDNRDAIGARVAVVVGGKRYMRQVRPHYSYLSSSERTVHFGLGGADRVDAVDIRWPNGTTERWTGLDVGRVHTLKQGQGTPIARPEAGPSARGT